MSVGVPKQREASEFVKEPLTIHTHPREDGDIRLRLELSSQEINANQAEGPDVEVSMQILDEDDVPQGFYLRRFCSQNGESWYSFVCKEDDSDDPVIRRGGNWIPASGAAWRLKWHVWHLPEDVRHQIAAYFGFCNEDERLILS